MCVRARVCIVTRVCEWYVAHVLHAGFVELVIAVDTLRSTCISPHTHVVIMSMVKKKKR